MPRPRSASRSRLRVPFPRGLAAAGALLAGLLRPPSAWAHAAPDEGAEWLMADWMLLAFLVFFVAALVAFVVALRRGLLSDLEEAKYPILRIREPDYYTPDWAKEEG